MKNFNRFFIGLFFLLISAPVLVFYSFNSLIPQENTENKAQSEFPRFELERFSTWPKTFEEWFSDYLPFKTQFIQAYRNFEYRTFGRFEQSDVIIGADEWLFYNKTINNYKGFERFTEAELKQALENTANYFSHLEENGIRCLFYIAPDKEQVYSEKMPDFYKRESELSQADQIVDYFSKNSEIKVIYPRQEFRELAQAHPLYFSTDTHWNELAGYLAAQQVWQEFTGEEMPLSLPGYAVGYSEGKDLANMVGLKKVLTEKNALIIDYPDEVSPKKIGTQDFGAIQRFQSDAPRHEKMILLGDSFSEYFLRSAIHDIDDIIFITFGQLSKVDVLAENPDYLAVMLVERNLPFLLNGFY